MWRATPLQIRGLCSNYSQIVLYLGASALTLGLNLLMFAPAKVCLSKRVMVGKVKTPCIGVCSTGIGDNVCRGCKRYTHEVAGWNGYGESERVSISRRLDALLRQVLEDRLEVFDEPLLRQQLAAHKVRHHAEQSPYAWIFEVIKVGAGQIKSLEGFGARLLPGYAHMPLPQFKKMVDEDFFVLSSVHYDRYFPAIFNPSMSSDSSTLEEV